MANVTSSSRRKFTLPVYSSVSWPDQPNQIPPFSFSAELRAPASPPCAPAAPRALGTATLFEMTTSLLIANRSTIGKVPQHN